MANEYGLVEWNKRNTDGKKEFTVLHLNKINNFESIEIIEGNNYEVNYGETAYKCVLKFKGSIIFSFYKKLNTHYLII